MVDVALTDEEMEHVRRVAFHPQVHITTGRWEADVDEAIAPLIRALWELKIETVMSCIGTWPKDPIAQKWFRHIGHREDDPPFVWIEFPEQDDLLRFLELAAGEFDRDPESIYNRICGDFRSEGLPWDVSIGPPLDAAVERDDSGEPAGGGPSELVLWSWSVRFPHDDFEAVITRVTTGKTVSASDEATPRVESLNTIRETRAGLASDEAYAQAIREQLLFLQGYWSAVDSNSWPEHAQSSAEEARAEIEWALANPLRLTGAQWDEYFSRLYERLDAGSCAARPDKTHSEAALRTMGLADQVEAIHRLVSVLGGHCDCEILMNAAEWIIPSTLEDVA